ncbi:alanine--tRNA ligase [Chitinophaga lutea]
MTAAEIRQQFLDFFASKGHHIVPSAPIVLKNDPTLKFTNAGMNQFKDIFLGNKPAPYKRVADTQKCLRVSGKHNDLEEVGIDTYHHTMFEMLGNWSFGDYFKKEAIAWSWELLTEVYKIPKDRLYVTVFEGDAKEGLAPDTEALEFWKEHIAEERILMGNKKDNFWEMGDTGPCGPCTEIHVDCRPDDERARIPGKDRVNNDDPQVIEIWNNVFMQFNRLKDKSLEPLPAKHVDTGMGFERLVRVLQQKSSNYDTDVFQPLIQATEKLCGKKYGDSEKTDIAFRVIADHIRAICFAIADGQLPSNTDAGYVIRRILRRAVRYYFSFLDVKKPLLTDLVPTLAGQFAHVFPELQQQVDFVKKVVAEEEAGFLRTLDSGIRRIEDFIAGNAAKQVDGKTAFELYDTYGFPLDLTMLIARENGFAVDEAGYEVEMKKQKDRSRAATELDMGDWTLLSEQPSGTFIGYTELSAPAKVLKYRKIKAKGKEQYQLVLDKTPFYAESGGQVGDTGVLRFGGETIEVTDTKKENDLIVHFTDRLPAQIDGPLTAEVDVPKRKATAAHHSATHLLHAALRKVLGTHVAQKGSLVNADNLRFDFSHFSKVTDEELAQIETIVNEKIRENIPVVIRELPREEALKLGAMALFGEKYGDVVRVVTIDPAYSVELCGGTHIGSTGELGLFKFLSEGAVAAGVRRVEAVTGEKAETYVNDQLAQLREVRNTLKNPKDIAKAVEALAAEKAALEKQLAAIELKQVQQQAATLPQRAINLNGTQFLGAIIDGSDVKQLAIALKDHLQAPYLAVLAAKADGKAQVAVLLSDDLAKDKGLNAQKIIKEQVAPLIKGGGGGQPTLASAGGQDASQLDVVIEKVKGLL